MLSSSWKQSQPHTNCHGHDSAAQLVGQAPVVTVSDLVLLLLVPLVLLAGDKLPHAAHHNDGTGHGSAIDAPPLLLDVPAVAGAAEPAAAVATAVVVAAGCCGVVAAAGAGMGAAGCCRLRRCGLGRHRRICGSRLGRGGSSGSDALLAAAGLAGAPPGP